MWTELLSLLIRSSAILLAAGALRRFPRTAAPEYRHRILVWAFGLLLLWPIFTRVVPEVFVPLWSGEARDGQVTVRERILARSQDEQSERVQTFLWIWLTGVLVALTPTLTSHFRVQRRRRQATPVLDADWLSLLAEVSHTAGLQRAPVLLQMPGDVMPQVFGLRKPCVLIPVDALRWPATRRRAVLLHELSHLKRRDLQTLLLVNVTAALWWFQPLCWTTRRQMVLEGERACDAAALAFGMRPSDYAAELLSIAQSFKLHAKVAWSAAPMAAGGPLEQRVRAIVGPRFSAPRTGLWAAASILLTILTITASALTVVPDRASLPTGGYSMRRTIFAGLLASAALATAATEGVVSDTSPAVTVSTTSKPIRVGGAVAQSNLVTKVNPVYPAGAKAAGLQGTVTLEAVISAEGVPEDVTVKSAPSDELGQSSVDAVKQWRYRPTLLNGKPVAIVTEVVVNYTLTK